MISIDASQVYTLMLWYSISQEEFTFIQIGSGRTVHSDSKQPVTNTNLKFFH